MNFQRPTSNVEPNQKMNFKEMNVQLAIGEQALVRGIWYSDKGVPDVKKIEFFEIPVVRVKSSNTMLTKEGCQVSIRDKITANGKTACYLTINSEEALIFRENPYMGQAKYGLYIV